MSGSFTDALQSQVDERVEEAKLLAVGGPTATAPTASDAAEEGLAVAAAVVAASVAAEAAQGGLPPAEAAEVGKRAVAVLAEASALAAEALREDDTANEEVSALAAEALREDSTAVAEASALAAEALREDGTAEQSGDREEAAPGFDPLGLEAEPPEPEAAAEPSDTEAPPKVRRQRHAELA